MNLIMIVIYYLLTLICLNKVLIKKYIYVLPIITLILIYSNINYFNKNLIVTMLDQTTPNMIQRISGVFERKPLISRGIIAFSKL